MQRVTEDIKESIVSKVEINKQITYKKGDNCKVGHYYPSRRKPKKQRG